MGKNKDPQVHVSVTFVTTKNVNKVQLMIQNPIDLTEQIGTYRLTDFDALKVAIDDVVRDPIYGLFFHHDEKHIHSFDESPFQFGAIYARREKKEEGEKAGKKITASRLTPIQTATQFEEHIKDVGEIVYQRQTKKRGRNKKATKKIDHYVLELCVIVLKKKKPALPKPTKEATTCVPPTTTIMTSTLSLTDESTINDDVEASESLVDHTTTQQTKKRKAPDAFKFKARKLSVCLHAPIETMQKKNGVKTTTVPTGKTVKDVVYNLDDYIFNMNSDGSVVATDEIF